MHQALGHGFVRFLGLMGVLLALSPAAVIAQSGPDYLSPDILDKPLGVTRLPNGNTFIADTGGANYTTTDAAVIEVDPEGNVVWIYAEPMAFTHSANLWTDGTILITDTGNDRVFRVDRDGNMVWTSDDWGGGTGIMSDGSHLDYPNDAELLDNGNMLLSDRNNDRVFEVTVDGEVVWAYNKLERPHNPDRLPNGNTVLSDSEANKVIEVDPAGNIVWEFGGDGVLSWPRDADRLDNGNTLVTDSRNNRIIEVTPNGEIVWQYKGLSIPYEADRLENGNTLISDNNHKRVFEVDPAGNIVWSFRNFPDVFAESLENGGFEIDEDGNGLPDGWYPADLNAEGMATFLWDAVERTEGERSAGLDYHGTGRIAWLQTIAVEPGQTYAFSGDIKAEISQGVLGYQLWFLDELGGPLGDPEIVQAFSASTDWQTTHRQVTAPINARAVQIWALTVADGRVWFDNISFGPPVATRNWPLWPGIGLAVVVVGAVVFTVRWRADRHADRHSMEKAR